MNTAVSPRPRTLVDVLPLFPARLSPRVREVLLTVGFAGFTALFAQIHVTLGFTPVPITGQTFAVLLAGTALGWRLGMASQLTYWIVGIVAPIPWYGTDTTGASIAAGWDAATGTTAGYLAGFVVAAAAVGYLAELGQDRDLATSIPAMLAGTAVIYVFGVTWLAYQLDVPIATGDNNAITLGLTPFLVGDLVKVVLAGVVTPAAWHVVGRFAARP